MKKNRNIHSVGVKALGTALKFHELGKKEKDPKSMKDAQKIVEAVKTEDIGKIMKSVINAASR